MSKLKTALLSTVVLGATCLSHPVFADQQGNAMISKTNYDSVSKTFEVIAQQSSNGKTIKQVDAAVWSEENGQDDIKWYSTSDISNGQARVRFNLANHGNHAGNYITHVYTNYADGSRSGVVMENTWISPKAPTLSLKDGGIRMSTDIYAPTNGTLYYAVWSEENGQDDIKWYADNGTGTTIADLKIIVDMANTISIHMYHKMEKCRGLVVKTLQLISKMFRIRLTKLMIQLMMY